MAEQLPKIASNNGGAVREWKPQEALQREAEAKAVKEYARAIKDWDTLRDAVDQQISDQRNLVEWWSEHVSVRHGPGHGAEGLKNADRRSLMSKDIAEQESGIAQQKVSKWRKLIDDPQYPDILCGPSYRKAMLERGSTDQKGASGTGENEWFTPEEYIELARQVLGRIDLDPATSIEAQKIVRAERFFTKAEDGLGHEWFGCVWMNPPYAQPHIANFVSKLCAEWQAGRVNAAIALTHNYTDTTWFHEIASNMTGICFTRGRVKFYEGDKVAAPTQGQAFSYFGQNINRFGEMFSKVGFLAVPW